EPLARRRLLGTGDPHAERLALGRLVGVATQPVVGVGDQGTATTRAEEREKEPERAGHETSCAGGSLLGTRRARRQPAVNGIPSRTRSVDVRAATEVAMERDQLRERPEDDTRARAALRSRGARVVTDGHLQQREALGTRAHEQL